MPNTTKDISLSLSPSLALSLSLCFVSFLRQKIDSSLTGPDMFGADVQLLSPTHISQTCVMRIHRIRSMQNCRHYSVQFSDTSIIIYYPYTVVKSKKVVDAVLELCSTPLSFFRISWTTHILFTISAKFPKNPKSSVVSASTRHKKFHI